jgi:hypothetical protein
MIVDGGVRHKETPSLLCNDALHIINPASVEIESGVK